MDRVLIIDDDVEAVRAIVESLSGQFHFDYSNSGFEGLRKAQTWQPDLIVLDYQIPDIEGVEICRLLKSDFRTRDIATLFVSGHSAIQNKAKAFEVGADDYIVKPFTPDELLLRMQTRIRKSRESKNHIISIANMEMDLRTGKVKVNGDDVQLTPKEFRLLSLFVQFRNSVVDRDLAISTIWHNTAVSLRNVDSQINNLRKKIRDFNGRIEPVTGVGYRLIV